MPRQRPDLLILSFRLLEVRNGTKTKSVLLDLLNDFCSVMYHTGRFHYGSCYGENIDMLDVKTDIYRLFSRTVEDFLSSITSDQSL